MFTNKEKENNFISDIKSDNNKIIAQTEYKVSDVSYSIAPQDLDYSETNITWLPNAYDANKTESISVDNLEVRLNKYKKPKNKKNSSGVLKGLYQGGFSGVHSVKSAPYLFYDIDVENSDTPEKNKHLLLPANNKKVFEELEKLSILCWRSNSGYGIAGILYVPQIAQYTYDTSYRHLIAGKHITFWLSKHLYNTTGIDNVVFDSAQSKFRQVRFVADQQARERKLNTKPFVFRYTSEVVEKKTPKGVTKYRYSDNRQSENSIYSQFNKDNNILDVLLNNGFTVVSKSGNKIRVKQPLSSSISSGFVDIAENVYINFSSSFDNTRKKRFSSSHIVCKFEFENNWYKFRQHLYTLGYQDKSMSTDEIKCVSKSLREELQDASNHDEANMIIFRHCFDLKHASLEVKRQFMLENCIRPEYEESFLAHLNFVDYKIKYNKELTIVDYVSEVLPSILDYADKHAKIICRAETGKGKTTAFVEYFHVHRPGKRILLLAPLTIIVDQQKRKYDDIGVFLTGESDGFDHMRAMEEDVVFSTYEQGLKHLDEYTFDYIIIDEVHQLLTANSFKAEVIADLTALFKDSKIIGLTGTPSAIFSTLDFKLLNVDVESPNLM